MIGYFIYRIAIISAEDFSVYLQSGFDLYRFELLKQMNLGVPITLSEERYMWEKLDEFFAYGNRFKDFQFNYSQSNKEEDSPKIETVKGWF